MWQKISLVERVSSVGACYLLVVDGCGHGSIGAQRQCGMMMLPIQSLVWD